MTTEGARCDVLVDFARSGGNRRIWFWTGLFTAMFVAWFAVTIDWDVLTGTFASIGPGALLAVAALLTVNGLLAALWLVVITRRRHGARGAFEIVGWQMLVSSVLP